MCKALKIKFNTNHHPHKSGDVVEFISDSEVKLAKWYMSNQIASEYCECKKTDEKQGCSECEKQK